MRGEDFPIVIVGNKNDLEEERKVNGPVTENIVCVDWGHAWLETSAFDAMSILKVFKTVLLKGKVSIILSSMGVICITSWPSLRSK